MAPHIKHLVVDSGGLINNAPIFEMAEELYSVEGVSREVRDPVTRQRLKVLPQDIQCIEPSSEDLKVIMDFAKKTGDYPTLSPVDIKVLALTYHLEKQHVGVEHLNFDIKPIVVATGTLPSSHVDVTQLSNEMKHLNVNSEETHSEEDDGDWITPGAQKKHNEETANWHDVVEDEGEEEDEGEWITPENIDEVKRRDQVHEISNENVTVACITTDFAMQNVLKQMGLNVVSVDGYLIRQARTYVLRCYGCFHITTDMNKMFCPKCGYKKLKRVSYVVDENGKRQIYINMSRPISNRGKIFPLPKPKGGMSVQRPILCADQREVKDLRKKKRFTNVKTNALDPHYESFESPFVSRDVFSRAFMLGAYSKDNNYWNRKNPNEVRKQSGKKKK